MGAYLSSPICDKDTTEGSNNHLAYAASSMQGWRMSQEDAHNAILNFDSNTSFFAVYDGHGGAEIALYCSRHLPDFIKQLNSYREGRLQDALSEGFIKFDSLLLEPNVKEILQVLADAKDKNDNDGGIDDSCEAIVSETVTIEELNVEEAHLLKQEANIPIEELLKRYKEKEAGQTSTTENSEITKEANKTSSANTDQTKQTDGEEMLKKDDTSEHTATETTVSNGEVSADTKPSSSELKMSSKRAQIPLSNDKPTEKSKSLTHKLLSDDADDLEDDEEDEDDSEYEESVDDSSEEDAGENEGEDDDDENQEEDENEDDEEQGEEDEDEETEEDEDNILDSSKAAEIKKLMKKSILAILNRHSKKKKQHDDNEDDSKENQKDEDGNEEGEGEDDNDEDEDEDDTEDENDADLGKMLDMSGDPGSSSGCTAVVTLLRDKNLFVANAGDSRCVVCRNGRAIEMSIDHKPEDPQERARIEKAGYKVTLDGRVSGGLNLSRAIGDHAYKKTIKLPAEEQAITALPDIRTLTLEDTDEFMVIACDGIWNFMSSQDVVDFVRLRLDKKSLSAICEELFMHCLAPNTSGDGTGCDNMTAIIVKFNFKQQPITETHKNSPEHSPWPTMFTPVNNKRSLSPEPLSTKESTDVGNEDDENSSKKFKVTPETIPNPSTSPSKTTGVFSFNAVSTTNNNSSDDQQH